jgi:hypothetical protein
VEAGSGGGEMDKLDEEYKAIAAQAIELAARELLLGAKKLRAIARFLADLLTRRAEEIEADDETKLGKK